MIEYKNRDFTLDKFRELCSIMADRYKFITMNEYVTAGNKLPRHFALMRHDVDKQAKNALKTASIEEEFDIKATYYFRNNKKSFVPEVIQKIANMGHEVGYHYEVLSSAKGDYKKAIKLFQNDVQKFRKICDLKTVCMHGAVLSKYDNRDLWSFYNLKDFGILGEAYLSIRDDVNYFTDTGRGWNSKNNLRDFIPGKTEKFSAKTTDDLIQLIKSNEINNFYISLHPDRWKSNVINWSFFWLQDYVLNSGKRVLMAVRQ